MSRYPRLLIGLAILAGAYWGLGGFGSPETATEPATDDAQSPDSTLETSAAMGGPDDGPHLGLSPVGQPGSPHPAILDRIGDWEEVTIERNESFYVALQRSGLTHETIMQVVSAAEPHVNLRRVRRGDTFNLARQADKLEAVRFDIDDERFLIVQQSTDGMSAEVAHYPIERLERVARGVIQTNLFDALKLNGADPALADNLAEILGWNIDFFRDLRVGDEFEVLYAEYRRENRSVRDPEVLSVRFVNKGTEHRAYRFDNEFGLAAYYDGDGGSLERQFLRAPLKFTRISSGFSHRRLHPVLKRYRPHYGVDYVAPTGTPVFATSDGTLIKRTRDRASGNFVGIRHGNGYESYYLHLSRFVKGQREGQRVKQGDVIGYVGSTGWATAPHLDYRIKKNAKWVNPKKLDLPPADPVADPRREEYVSTVERFDSMFAGVPATATNFVLARTPVIFGESVTTR
jgi:murein DD-endopeptidase MepM/ murein hydrolase activator NlpD